MRFTALSLCVLASCTTTGGTHEPDVEPRAMLNALIGSAPELDEMIAKVAAARDASKGRERDVLGHVVRALESSRQAPQDLVAHVQDTASVMRDYSALYPKNLAVQRDVTVAITSLAYSASAIGIDPVPLRREALDRAHELVEHFPNASESHGVLASAIAINGGNALAVGEEYKRCAALAPSTPHCQASLDRIRADYNAPQCSGAAIRPNVAAYAEDASNARAATPSLTHDDFASITRYDDQTLHFEMILTAAGKLETVTGELASRGGSLAMIAGDELIASARVMEPVSGGHLQMNPGISHASDEILAKLCLTVTRRELPAEIR